MALPFHKMTAGMKRDRPRMEGIHSHRTTMSLDLTEKVFQAAIDKRARKAGKRLLDAARSGTLPMHHIYADEELRHLGPDSE